MSGYAPSFAVGKCGPRRARTGRGLRNWPMGPPLSRIRISCPGRGRDFSMLAIARKCGTDAPLAAAEAYRLPFADARFDCVSDITVVQHIPLSLQSAALGEMIRVLKPNGRLILMELIRGNGAHIFPHDPQEWIDQVRIVGGSLVEWFGQEYLLFDRVFVRTVHAVTGSNRRGPSLAPLAEETFPSQRPTAARGAYWGLRRVTTQVSNWLEPVAERIFPPGLATHGVFLFRKR